MFGERGHSVDHPSVYDRRCAVHRIHNASGLREGIAVGSSASERRMSLVALLVFVMMFLMFRGGAEAGALEISRC